MKPKRPLSRAELEATWLRMKALTDELDRREAERSLLAFVKLMWPTVEPARKFIEGWHIEAICEHLEAVTRGDIKKLLVNISPGHCKSLLTNVFWPAWEWGPRSMASMRYMCAAYSQALTIRDNIRFRQVITSPLYKQHWSDRFGPSADSFSVEKTMNDKTGWKLATSVGGVGTGERGDRVICLPYEQRVLSSIGWIRIGDLVDGRLNVLIASFDFEARQVEWRPIESWQVHGPDDLIEIETDGGERLVVTQRHRVHVEGRGYVEARDLQPGDIVLGLPVSPDIA